MDPNATLAEIRDLLANFGNDSKFDALELVERVEALDKWLSNYGCLPGEWQAASD